jgi:hypothetical protein
MSNRECVYVIGAGFSAGLEYPQLHDLLTGLWGRLEQPLKDDLEKIVRFHHPNFRPNDAGSFPNIEQLMTEMYVNDELFHASRQYEGNFTKQKLQDTLRDLLLAITAWFHELSIRVNPTIAPPSWLRQFKANVLQENAAIISFNWDLILDQLLFGTKIDGGSYGFRPSMGAGPILLKPHGSLNWFEEEHAKFLKEHKRVLIHKSGRAKNAIYAFQEFRNPRTSHKRIYSPFIAPPTLLKNFKKPIFRDLWRNCTSVLSTARRVVFLGYSMPAADLHAQFIMRCGFHNQIEGELKRAGKRATPTGPRSRLDTVTGASGCAGPGSFRCARRAPR